MSLLNSVKNCDSVNGNDDILNKFWKYEGIYEKRLRFLYRKIWKN